MRASALEEGEQAAGGAMGSCGGVSLPSVTGGVRSFGLACRGKVLLCSSNSKHLTTLDTTRFLGSAAAALRMPRAIGRVRGVPVMENLQEHGASIAVRSFHFKQIPTIVMRRDGGFVSASIDKTLVVHRVPGPEQEEGCWG